MRSERHNECAYCVSGGIKPNQNNEEATLTDSRPMLFQGWFIYNDQNMLNQENKTPVSYCDDAATSKLQFLSPALCIIDIIY